MLRILQNAWLADRPNNRNDWLVKIRKNSGVQVSEFNLRYFNKAMRKIEEIYEIKKVVPDEDDGADEQSDERVTAVPPLQNKIQEREEPSASEYDTAPQVVQHDNKERRHPQPQSHHQQDPSLLHQLILKDDDEDDENSSIVSLPSLPLQRNQAQEQLPSNSLEEIE